MTYEEQLKIQALNHQIIQNIVDTVEAEKFINFYLAHNQKETMEEFGIRTLKQLRKILEIFNYDFSKPKPSKFKGKNAVRSHESYIAGGKKSSDTQKANWANKTEEEKCSWSEKQKVAHNTETFKTMISQINREYHKNLSENKKKKLNKKRSATMKEYLNNLPEEEFTDWINRGFKLYTVDNYYFDSFPELCFYLYHKQANNKIIRSSQQLEYFYNGEKHYYLPDFELDGQLYEIKGDHLFEKMQQPNTLDNAKYKCMLKNNVAILQSEDYLKYEKWFIDTGLNKEDYLRENIINKSTQ